MIVQKNEQISHKRWFSNQKWVQAYEEEFLMKVCKFKPIFQNKEKRNQLTLKQLIKNKNNIIIIKKTDQLMNMFKMYNIMKEDIHQMTTDIHKSSEDIINI